MSPAGPNSDQQKAGANPSTSAELGAVARRLYQERRARDELFGNYELGEGAWDILLDLYSATAEGSPVTIMSACLAAQLPRSTAQRLVKKLEADGLISSVSAPLDKRIKHLALTVGTEQKMTVLLDRIANSRSTWPARSLASRNGQRTEHDRC